MVGDSLNAAPAPLDETLLRGLVARAVAGDGPVGLIGRRMHDLAARLLADGVRVEVTVPRRRDARALRRAGRDVARLARVADIRIDLPYRDSDVDLLICRLDPRTFPFPRHTVRELGRSLAPGGVLALLPGAKVSWPAGLVDAWAAAAGLVPPVERGMGGAGPFSGAVYESPA